MLKIKTELLLFKNYLNKKNNFVKDILEKEDNILNSFKEEKLIKKKSLIVL